MPRITQSMTLDRVEHILASGTGVLDFAVAGEDQYYTWDGTEEAEWTVEDVKRAENAEEDRLVFHPTGEFFTCEITADSEEHNEGPVHCYCHP